MLAFSIYEQMKTKMVKAVYVILLVMFFNSNMFAQVSINTDGAQPDNSAMLDVSSTTKGMLIPRMTNGEIQAILLPATGLMVFQTDGINGLYYNAGSPATPDWKLVGFNAVNTSTISDADGDTYITTDEAPSNPDNDAIHFWVKGNNTMSLVDNRLVVFSGFDNLFIGDNCGAIETGSGNLYIGTRAGEYANSGTYSVALGSFAGRHNQHNFNTFVGTYSGTNNTTGWNNTFLGYETGYNNITGTQNTFLGFVSGHNNLSGENNVYIGDSAGYSDQTGSRNVFIGNQAGKTSLHGYKNVFIGNQAGKNETGSYKLYISNTDTSRPLIYGKFDERLVKLHAYRLELINNERNVIIGENSNPGTGGIQNVFVGSFIGQGNAGGSNNVFIGDSAGASNTFGSENFFAGAYSGMNNSDGSQNVFLGYRSGYENTHGNYNVFIGDSTGESNNTGTQNTFLGAISGKNNTTGTINAFIGYKAGESNTTGHRNTFVGPYAGFKNTTGQRNTYVGLSAGCYNTTGKYNTFIGRVAGYNNEEGSGNVFIGNMAGYNETGSYKLYIANNDTIPPLIYGEFDNSLLKFHGQVEVVDHDIYIDNSDFGIILKSPNGTCYRVTVNNDGSLSTILVDCP
jgi:hypothetical protein